MSLNQVEIWPRETGIRDLPEDWPVLSQTGVRRVETEWSRLRSDQKLVGSVGQFSDRLHREWAIETGQIENLYEIDRGVTETLIEIGFAATNIPLGSVNRPPDFVKALISDHQEALEGLFDFIKGDRQLTTGYVKELHAVMTRSQPTTEARSGNSIVHTPLLHGAWKVHPNYPQREGTEFLYCPPEFVQDEMERLLAMHEEHTKQGVPPEVESAWLHHRFTQIHPFQDGNGRIARALATLVLVRAGLFPLIVPISDKDAYITSLEHADQGDLAPLVRLISLFQQRALRKAASALAPNDLSS